MVFCCECGYQLLDAQASDTASYYDLLGISLGASREEVALASEVILRRLANSRREDAAFSPRELERRVVEATKVLSNPELRRSYDAMSAHSLNAVPGRSSRATPPHVSQQATRKAPLSAPTWDIGPSSAPPRDPKAPQWDFGQPAVPQATAAEQKPNAVDPIAGFFRLLGIGFFAWMLVVLLVFPISYLLLIPAIRGTFFPDGRWIGLATPLTGMLIWIVLLPIVYVCLLVLQVATSMQR